MPVTRSFNQQARTHPFPTPSPPLSRSQSQNATTTQHSKEIAVSVTSSDAESTASKKNTTKKKNEKPRTRPPPIIEVDIIEISSDDETPAPRPKLTALHTAVPSPEPAAIADFRRQISQYRGEAAKSKKDLEKVSKEVAELREENKELQKLRKAGTGKITLDAINLSDQLECEICTSRMWTPYVLPDCGHTFCQSCIQDWFSASQAQFMTNHPGYNPNQLISNQSVVGLYNIAQGLMHNPHTANSPHITALVAQFLPPHPQYTCPTCRETVTSRPIEVFALKGLFRTITSAMGESSPKRPKQLDKGPVVSPWDGFFAGKKA